MAISFTCEELTYEVVRNWPLCIDMAAAHAEMHGGLFVIFYFWLLTGMLQVEKVYLIWKSISDMVWLLVVAVYSAVLDNTLKPVSVD